MSYHIEKTIQFHDTEVKVYYRDHTDNNHVIWTDNCGECTTFSKKSDATVKSNEISEQTTVVKR